MLLFIKTSILNFWIVFRLFEFHISFAKFLDCLNNSTYFLYFFLSNSLWRPIIYISGLQSSSLLVSISKPDLYPACPTFINYCVWPYPDNPDPKYAECLAQIFLTVYNQTANTISHQPGIELTPDPIGNYKHFRRFRPFAEKDINRKKIYSAFHTIGLYIILA